MNESAKTFRDKLLDVEKLNTAYREKYEKEMQEMVEKKLIGWTKLSHIIGLIMGLGFAVLFGTAAVIVPKEFPLWGRFIFALGAVFGLIIIVFEGWVLKKGTINLKEDVLGIAGLGWCFVVILAVVVMLFSKNFADPIIGVHGLVVCLIFLVMAAVGLVKAYIQRSELNTREKLLEIEYRIAELAEKIENKSSE